MKIKSIVKYYLYEIKYSILVFYITMLLLCIATYVGYKISDGELYSTGIELTTIIFLFVLGLNLFKSQFYFLIQNGVTRKANFIGFLVSTLVVVLFATIDSFISVIMHNLIGYESFYYILYAGSSQGYGLMYIIESILFLTAMYGAFFMLGYFITILYYAMNKTMKVIVSVSVPTFFIIGLPLIDYFFKLNISSKIEFIVLNMLGIYNNSANIINPILSCIVIYTILSLLTYVITRRISVKG